MGRTRRAAGRRVDSIAKWLLQFRIIAIPARIIASSNLAWSLVSRTDRIRTNRLKERILNDEIPKHVSIIMDGNRRFAWHRKIETKIGHQKGKEKLKEVMDWVLDLKIPYLSVYALSTENINERYRKIKDNKKKLEKKEKLINKLDKDITRLNIRSRYFYYVLMALTFPETFCFLKEFFYTWIRLLIFNFSKFFK